MLENIFPGGHSLSEAAMDIAGYRDPSRLVSDPRELVVPDRGKTEIVEFECSTPDGIQVLPCIRYQPPFDGLVDLLRKKSELEEVLGYSDLQIESWDKDDFYSLHVLRLKAEGHSIEQCCVFEHNKKRLDAKVIRFPASFNSGWLTGRGWHINKISDSHISRLLKDFQKLETNPERAQVFVERWGPLWLCGTHWGKRLCLCPPYNWAQWLTFEDCSWYPVEPIQTFQYEAARVNAVLFIAKQLGENKPVPLEYWHKMDLSRHISFFSPEIIAEQPIDDQRREFAIAITRILSVLAKPMLSVGWSSASEFNNNTALHHPSLSFNPGTGFLPMIWTHVAQIITNAKGLYTCAGCGLIYVADKSERQRRPSENRSNYCDGCRQTGAKQDWAKRARNRKLVCPKCGITFPCGDTKPLAKLQGKCCPKCRKIRS